jgi:hypothetical protein
MLKEEVVEGIPEVVAAQGYFESLFPDNHHLVFDTVKGDFSIKKENRGTVFLSASGAELSIATKALERLDFEVMHGLSVPPSSDIQVVQTAKGWLLSYPGKTQELESLEELCRQVKQLKPQPKS